MDHVKKLEFNRILTYLGIYLLIILLSGCGNTSASEIRQNPNMALSNDQSLNSDGQESKLKSVPKEVIDVKGFIRPGPFSKSLDQVELVAIEESVKAAIIPHHDVAMNMIADTLGSIAKVRQPETIVLLVPNHKGTEVKFQLCDYDYSGHTGTLISSSVSINELLEKDPFEKATYDLASKEHGINILVHYIKHYFPNTQIVAVMMGEPDSAQEIQYVADALTDVQKDHEVLYLASVDFSHYLPLDQAMQRDNETRQYLEAMDTSRLLALGDDYVDSPLAVVLLTKIVENLGGDKSRILDNDNMANILNRPNLESTTSYFTVVYE